MARALLLTKNETALRAEIGTIQPGDLPEGDVTVDVLASTLNYKDALAITGKAPIVRRFPMVPGIDFAGTVAESSHQGVAPGDRVVLNGWGLGETRWGGMAELARVQGEWLVPLPGAFSPEQAMAVGTAGYTAMLCVLRLEEHGVGPDKGPLLVTGASGGVGSVAIALLARLGYEVWAMTGRPEQEGYLRSLGAAGLVARADYEGPARPLAKERWAGGVDAAGGTILANLLAACRYRGVVACCGLAASMELPTSVAPFILRGVTLAGVDSVYVPRERRLEAWERLARDLDPDLLARMTSTIGLGETVAAAGRLLAGGLHGRVVVDVRR